MTSFPNPTVSCAGTAPHGAHLWVDPTTWAGGANVAVYNCPGRQGPDTALLEAAMRMHAVQMERADRLQSIVDAVSETLAGDDQAAVKVAAAQQVLIDAGLW